MSVLARIAAAFGRLGPRGKAVVILGVGILGFALLMLFRPRPAQEEPRRLGPLVSTVAAEVRSGHLTVRGPGTVRPRSEVVLAPQVPGRVEWVSPALVSGGRFARGDVLLGIERADYENAVEIASAEVAQRRVEVLEAEERRALAVEEYERLRRREGLEAVPDSSELGSLIFREPQLEAARAALRRAEARLEDARLSLRRTQIRAPFDGIVLTESVDAGQYVSPGQALARVYTTDEVEIVVALSDEEAALVDGLWAARAGDSRGRIPATVRASFGGRSHTWPGYVDRAEGALNPETRTVDVVVRVPEPFDTGDGSRPPLLLGTYADVDIRGALRDRYVVLPRAAFRDGASVWAVREDTLLTVVPAAFIQEVDGLVYVDADLSQGERVVVSPMSIVTDGMNVRLAEPSP